MTIINACGRHINLNACHFVALGALFALVCVAVPVGFVVVGTNNKNNKDETPPAGPALMEVPVYISNEDCEYKLFENDSTFHIDEVFLNGEPIANEGVITARPGSRLRFKGGANTCSVSGYCPSCIAQLYISLMDYDDGNLYDPCKYRWAGQVILEDQDSDSFMRPPRNTSTECFDNRRRNSDCSLVLFDEEFVLDTDLYPVGDSTRYSVVLSNSYQYSCQKDLMYNELQILRVYEDYFLEVEGEIIEDVNV